MSLLVSSNSIFAEPSASISTNTHIQILAASCAACHGTNGNSVSGSAVLAGLDASYFSQQMLAFKTGNRASTVMHRHAKGLTTEEIEQLAHYFSSQKRTAAALPKPYR